MASISVSKNWIYNRLPSPQGGGDGRELEDLYFDELEELVGIIAGDGCLASDEGTIKIDIHSEETKLKERIQYLFKALFNKEVKISKNEGNWITLRVYSRELHKFFAQFLPIGKKAGKLGNLTITPSVLRGIFLTDGYLQIKKDRSEVNITSKDYKLLENIQAFLSKMGVSSKIYKRKSGFKTVTTTFALRIFRRSHVFKFLKVIGF